MLIFMQASCVEFFLFYFDLWDFSPKMTCCFLQSDVLFFCVRSDVKKPQSDTQSISQDFEMKYYRYQPPLARTRTRALQEFFSFCCHKCHSIIDKVLYFSLL